jgi:hypothetical protein
MAERRAGAGSRLSGVLERATPPSRVDGDEPDADARGAAGEPHEVEAEAATPRGRGAGRRPRAAEGRAARRVKGRTIYLPDDLFERILIQAHRRDKTISEYVTTVLERQVPDYRQVRGEPAEGDGGPS